MRLPRGSFSFQARNGLLTSKNYRGSITAVVFSRVESPAMSSPGTYRLGDLQLRIMRVLWNLGPASVAQVQERLDGGRLAYTTVATMLRKMEDRGLVAHRE